MAISGTLRPWTVAVLAAALPLVFAGPVPGAGKRAFHDPFGDVTCCTRDLTDITVRNDDAGTISVEAGFDDSVEDGDDDDLIILLDTDRNAATGMPYAGAGIDYMIGAHVMPDRVDGVSLSTWDRDRFRETRTSHIRVSVSEQRVRISVDRHLIGDTDDFAFRLEVWEVTSFGGANADFAPDTGTWTFPVRIAVGRLQPLIRTAPQPRAGHRFVGRLGLRVAGTGQFLASGSVRCAAGIGRRHLMPLAATFVHRRAVCIWDVPGRTRGKILRGSIGVGVTAGSRVSRRFALAIG